MPSIHDFSVRRSAWWHARDDVIGVNFKSAFLMAIEVAHIRVNGIASGYVSSTNIEDLERSLLMLASSASRYLTGTTLVVDSGQLVSSL